MINRENITLILYFLIDNIAKKIIKEKNIKKS